MKSHGRENRDNAKIEDGPIYLNCRLKCSTAVHRLPNSGAGRYAVPRTAYFLVGVFTLSGLYTPFVFVYEKAISEVGVSNSKASLIISLLGIFNTIGRLIAGWLADRPWADSLVIYNVAAILAGLLTCLVSVIFSFELLCVYAALFGILIGSYRNFVTYSLYRQLATKTNYHGRRFRRDGGSRPAIIGVGDDSGIVPQSLWYL